MCFYAFIYRNLERNIKGCHNIVLIMKIMGKFNVIQSKLGRDGTCFNPLRQVSLSHKK